MLINFLINNSQKDSKPDLKNQPKIQNKLILRMILHVSFALWTWIKIQNNLMIAMLAKDFSMLNVLLLGKNKVMTVHYAEDHYHQ